jgi:ketosteroid isomerase-like protein
LQQLTAIVRHMASRSATPFSTQSDRFANAIRQRDVLTACSIYAEDARLMAPSAREITGRSEIEAFWQAGLNSGIREAVFESTSVLADDLIACDSGHYTLRFEPAESAPVIERGHYVHIHTLQPDGTWQRIVEIFTPGGAE